MEPEMTSSRAIAAYVSRVLKGGQTLAGPELAEDEFDRNPGPGHDRLAQHHRQVGLNERQFHEYLHPDRTAT
jgi:hypothetical protein